MFDLIYPRFSTLISFRFVLSVILYTGAGPGAAYSFHGGGHGGRGGGFLQDRNSTKYGWNYVDNTYLLGGSTGID